MIRDTIPSDIKLPNPSPSHQNNFLKLKRKFTEKKKRCRDFSVKPKPAECTGAAFQTKVGHKCNAVVSIAPYPYRSRPCLYNGTINLPSG